MAEIFLEKQIRVMTLLRYVKSNN